MVGTKGKILADVLVLSFVLFMVLGYFSVGIAQASHSNAINENSKIKAYTSHSPIRINSNADFTAANGVVSGSGTKDDPYIISGWDIDAHGAGTAIYIGNTTAYFVVENCVLNNASYNETPYFTGAGITLYNVTNGVISNISSSNSKYGVYLYESSENIIENSNLTFQVSDGILISHSNNNTILNDTCMYNKYVGISLDMSIYNTILGNKISDNAYYDIYMYQSSNNKILNNKFSNTNAGLYLDSSTNNNKIYDNEISNNFAGILIKYSSNNNISNNKFFDNLGGVSIGYSDGNIITNNNISNNMVGISMTLAVNSTISGNNCSAEMGLGIYLNNSNDNLIYNNNCSDDYEGLYLNASNENIININVFYNDTYYGVEINSGSNNLIFFNVFYRNNGTGNKFNPSHIQAYDGGTDNHWNTTNGMGNYWYDWANNNDTNDANNDGIVDWPYPIDGPAGDKDYYPLICSVIGESAPPQPYNLNARAGDEYVNLTWDMPVCNGSSPISQYRIYRNGTLIATVSFTQLYYNDTEVKNGVNYSYYVTAVSSVGESKPSNTVYAIPMTIPSSPQNLQAKAGNRYVNLSWEAPRDNGGSGIKEYRIYRNGTLIATVPAIQLWYNDTSVANGVNYTYYVTAVNSVGESKPSNDINATPVEISIFPTFWIVVIGIIVIVAIVAVIGIIKYKKKI